MASSFFRNRWIVPLVMVAAAITYVWVRSRPPRPLGEAYVSERVVTLWSSTAEVRAPAGIVHYGDRVTVLARSGTVSEVRTLTGATGWLDSVELMDPDLWEQSVELLKKAQAMPVQATGHTKTLTNLHVLPGRDEAHIFQFSRDVPVVVLSRATAPGAPPPAGSSPAQSSGGSDDQKPKAEDWLLVMRSVTAQETSGENGVAANAGASEGMRAGAPIVVAGWVLARFIEFDTPGPVHDYALSSDFRVVAWVELNRVLTDSGDMPQYLVAGTRGPEGEACDFSLLRVYTWSERRKQYETAFVGSDLCGKLPLLVSQVPDGTEFRFAQADSSGERIYVMHQSVVRRVRADETSMTGLRHN